MKLASLTARLAFGAVLALFTTGNAVAMAPVPVNDNDAADGALAVETPVDSPASNPVKNRTIEAESPVAARADDFPDSNSNRGGVALAIGMTAGAIGALLIWIVLRMIISLREGVRDVTSALNEVDSAADPLKPHQPTAPRQHRESPVRSRDDATELEPASIARRNGSADPSPRTASRDASARPEVESAGMEAAIPTGTSTDPQTRTEAGTLTGNRNGTAIPADYRMWLRRWVAAHQAGDLLTCEIMQADAPVDLPPNIAESVQIRLGELRAWMQDQLRRDFQQCVKRKDVAGALQVGDRMLELLPHSSVADEFQRLRPQLESCLKRSSTTPS